MQPQRILLTNDDGIESEGLHVLTKALAGAGHEVMVVAPNRDWSGAGASIGRFSPDEKIGVERVDIPGCDGVEAWAIDGPPGLAVLATALGAFGKEPDLVVSGINPGGNSGRAVLHSGTVGAVLTAQNFGWSGLAVSLQWSEPWHWDTAAEIAMETLPLLVDAPPRSALNLNVPNRPRSEVGEVRWARLAPFGEVRAAMAAPTDGRLQFKFEEPPEDIDVDPDDTDAGLIRLGHASLTALVGVVEAWPADAGLDEDQVEMFEGIVPGAPWREVHRVPDTDTGAVLRRSHDITVTTQES